MRRTFVWFKSRLILPIPLSSHALGVAESALDQALPDRVDAIVPPGWTINPVLTPARPGR
jgi:hypothetical protein